MTDTVQSIEAEIAQLRAHLAALQGEEDALAAENAAEEALAEAEAALQAEEAASVQSTPVDPVAPTVAEPIRSKYQTVPSARPLQPLAR